MEELIKRIEKLEKENKQFKTKLTELQKKFNNYPELKNLCEGIQYWVNHEYDSDLKEWLTSDFAIKIQQWFIEHAAPEVQNWIDEEYSKCVQEWVRDYVTERLNIEPMDCVQIVTSRIHKDDPELKCNDLAATFREHGANVRGCYGIDVNNHCEKATFMQVSGIDLDRIMQILRAFVKTSDKTKDPEYYIDFIK